MPRTTKSGTNLRVPITAASSRPSRTRPLKSTAKASNVIKKTGTSGSKRRGGKSTGPTKATTTGGGSSGRITKRKGHLSEASKARKRGETAAAKLAAKGGKATKTMKGNAKQSGHDGNGSPAGAPKPKKVFNDELNNTDLEYEAEVIRDSMIEGGKLSYLVKWVGWPEEANTWEPEVNLRNSIDLITEFDKLHPDKP